MSGAVNEYWSIGFTDANGKTNWFVDLLNRKYNFNCQIKCKNVSFKKLFKPWITQDLVRDLKR